jgi:hypothetical protein
MIYATCLALGLSLVMAAVAVWIDRRRRIPSKPLAIYIADLNEELRAHHQICLEKAASEIRIARVLEQMPHTTFTPPILEAVRMGYAAERAVLDKARELGLLGDLVIDTQAPVEPSQRPSLPPLSENGSSLGPSTVWRNGKQMPAPSRKIN